MQKGRCESGAESVSEKEESSNIYTCNQQSFSLSKKRSLAQKEFFDNEWVMFESSARVNMNESCNKNR